MRLSSVSSEIDQGRVVAQVPKETCVIHETTPSRYVVQQAIPRQWISIQGFNFPEAAVAYADRQQQEHPNARFRVIDTKQEETPCD